MSGLGGVEEALIGVVGNVDGDGVGHGGGVVMVFSILARQIGFPTPNPRLSLRCKMPVPGIEKPDPVWVRENQRVNDS